MGRKPRVFVPGALYHVYNRICSGDPVFAEDAAALWFIEEVAEVRRRDGWRVLAWCLMSNHYHLVVRSGEPPLWRGLHRVQNLLSRRYNQSHGRTGPLWQSRYHAKLILDERYLGQVILYVHLNPVRAGAIGDPARYPYSGHGEIVGKQSWGVTDVEQALLCFGETRRSALRVYRAAISASLAQVKLKATDEMPPAGGKLAAGLWYDEGVPYVDELGRSTAMERPGVPAQEFVKAASGLLGVKHELLAGRSRNREVSRARRLVVLLGVERWGLQGRDLAGALGRTSDVVSWMLGRAVRERQEDEGFRQAMDELDHWLAESVGEARGRGI